MPPAGLWTVGWQVLEHRLAAAARPPHHNAAGCSAVGGVGRSLPPRVTSTMTHASKQPFGAGRADAMPIGSGVPIRSLCAPRPTGSAELRALHAAFLCAGLVDHSLLSSGQETIRPAALIQFHDGQIADSVVCPERRLVTM